MRPSALHLFTYQVGFGDCFLLRFIYPDRARHVLIDFGTMGLPASAPNGQLVRIAEHIAASCGGHLDAVVATHRHADHISGFATNEAGTAPGDIIRKLAPDVVVQPWTEDLALATDAQGPSTQSARFHGALRHMQGVAREVLVMLDSKRGAKFDTALADQLRFLGQDNLSNLSAVINLSKMGKRNSYVFHGSVSGLEEVLPGIRTHVLGPPTLEQTQSIRRMRANDPDEFWQLRLTQLRSGGGAPGRARPAFPEHVAARGGKLPMSSRWLAGRIREAQGEQLLSLVRALDKQMNNTSIILLFEAGSKKLLFPGDAQIENWEYALAQPRVLKLLSGVDLYKVGHHGSRNATPRSMWAAFQKKGKAEDPERMHAVLSTKSGKHGSVSSRTEVPRTALLKEIGKHAHLHNTETMEPGALCEKIEFEL